MDKNIEAFLRLKEVVDTLRGEEGCSWDKRQTHASLKPYLLEEAIEVITAADIYERTGNDENLCEELGDVLFQVMLHSKIAEEEGRFTIADVMEHLCEKMVHRHPHVFGEISLEDKPDWEALKRQEKEGRMVLTKAAKEKQKETAQKVRRIVSEYEKKEENFSCLIQEK